MKIKTLKKENRGLARTCFKGGFALLFSVLVSSLLLTIGLSILNISIKELAISTASKQSIHAFYAADSGLECAKYWDLKKGYILNLVDEINGTIGRTSTTIVCAGTSKLLDPINPKSGFSTSFASENMLVNDGTDDANFDVIIDKSWSGIISEPIHTTIDSVGHNSNGGDRVERAIQQTY